MERRTTRPTAEAAAMPALAPVLSPAEGIALEEGDGVAIVIEGVDFVEERELVVVVVGDVERVSYTVVGADVGADDASWVAGISSAVNVILAISARGANDGRSICTIEE